MCEGNDERKISAEKKEEELPVAELFFFKFLE